MTNHSTDPNRGHSHPPNKKGTAITAAPSLSLERDELRLKPVTVRDRTQGSPWLRELYDDFAPVRQEAAERGYTDEEINGWIDEAVAAVRRERHG